MFAAVVGTEVETDLHPKSGEGHRDEPACGSGVSIRLAVGIATVRRPQMLRLVLDRLAQQTRPADGIIVCAPTAEDIGDDSARDFDIEMRIGPRGLTRQRNAIMEAAQGFDILVFFDDDFLPSSTYLAGIEQVFIARDDVVMATGRVISDGIIGPGLHIEAASRILQMDPSTEAGTDGYFWLDEVANCYGCNMAVRMAVVRAHNCCFDERLPLYGWLEDVDFSQRVARHGRIVKTSAASGVHLGIKQGRQSGLRLGYSQIANPIYLCRKGTCPWPQALKLIARNLGANCLRSLRPEPYVDRLGRARGNLKAFSDLVLGKLDPERILQL